MEYRIHYIDRDECAQAGLIHCLAWKAAYKGIVPGAVLDEMTPQKSAERFQSRLPRPNRELALLTGEGKPAGILSLGRCRDKDGDEYCGEIYAIYLLPEFWRRGLGTALLRWGLGELKARGFQRAVVWVFADNRAARLFYERMGFSPDGAEQELLLGKPLKACRYAKNLGSFPD